MYIHLLGCKKRAVSSKNAAIPAAGRDDDSCQPGSESGPANLPRRVEANKGSDQEG